MINDIIFNFLCYQKFTGQKYSYHSLKSGDLAVICSMTECQLLKFYCNIQKDITNRYRQLYQRKTSKTTEECCWTTLEKIRSGPTNQLLYLKAQIPGSTFPNSKCITFLWLGCPQCLKVGILWKQTAS